MRNVAKPATRLTQGVVDAQCALLERIQNPSTSRDDNVTNHPLIFIRPEGEIQFPFAVLSREYPRTVELVEDLNGVEESKATRVNRFAYNLPHGLALFGHDGEEARTVNIPVRPPSGVRGQLPSRQLSFSMFGT